MFKRKYLSYWFMLFMGLFFFIISLITNQVVGGALAIILLIASNGQCDNKNLQLVSKVLAVIVTIITVKISFFS